MTRDALLRQRHWNFALFRVILSRLALPPVFGRAYQYKLPSDYLLAVEFNGQHPGTGEANFDVVGDTIQADDSTAALLYVRRVTECSKWDSSFCEAFGYKLAAAIAPSITTAAALADRLAQVAEQVTLRAFGPDNLETRPRAVLATNNSAYLNARLGVSSSPRFTPTINLVTGVPAGAIDGGDGSYLVDELGNVIIG